MDLLLHICCGSCATHVIESLKANYTLKGYFYNPNIHPEEEYRCRLDDALKLSETLNVPFLAAPYDPERWSEAIRGLEEEPEGGERCEVCFRLRLEEAARTARREKIPVIATTLTTSPHKNARLINLTGASAAKKEGVEFLPADFKKKDGFKRSVKLSLSFGLTRQDYCGCIYSLKERDSRKSPVKE